MMDKSCPCLTDAQACCACISMHCDECHKPMQSKFVQGRFCSNCGRPLKAELQSEFEELKKQNEALTINMNAYALGMIALKEQKDVLIKNYAECMKDYAREIFEELDERLDKIVIVAKRETDYSSFLSTIQQLFDAVGVVVSELKKKYTEGEG